MSTATSNEDLIVSDDEVDEIVAATLANAGIDLESLRQQASAGQFDSERQRRAWFVIRGLGRD